MARLTTAQLDALEQAQPKRRFTTAELDAMAPHELTEREQAAQGASEAFNDSTGWQKFGIGIAKPVVEGYEGGRVLLRKALGKEPKVDVSSQERLKAIRGGAATGGEILGNIAMLAAPGGATTLLPRALARVGADVALNAAASGVQSVGRGEEFGTGAAWGAGGSLLGAGIGAARAARPALAGGAKELLDRGVRLTPGMAANGTVRKLENVGAELPVVGGAVRRMQQRATQDWNKGVMDKTLRGAGLPEINPQVAKTGHAGVAELKDALGKQYDMVWGTAEPDVAKLGRGIADAWSQGAARLDPGDAKRLGGTVEAVTARINAGDLQGADRMLRKLADNAEEAGKDAETETFHAVRAAMQDSLPDAHKKALAKLNSAYREFLPVQRASTYVGPMERQGVFTPKELLQAVKVGRMGEAATGSAPLQQEATSAMQIIGKSLPYETESAVQKFGPWTAGVGLPAAAVLGHPVAAAVTAGTLGAGRAAVNEPMRKLIVEKLIRKQPLTPKEIETAVRLGVLAGGAGARSR